MDLGLNGAIDSFQKRIGTYDKANWEIIVEKQSIPQISETSSVAKLPTDLLDVDLIRGSSFTKSKPGYHWTQVTANGLLKILFFPIYFKWWRAQISVWVWAYLTLYFLQLFGLVIYFVYQTDESLMGISWPEVFLPIMAMILVGELFIHVVSSNFTKPMAHKMKKNKKKRSHSEVKRTGRKERKKNSKRARLPNSPLDPASDEGIESFEGRRVNDTSPERITSREESVERPLNSDEESVIPSAKQQEVAFGYELKKRITKKVLGPKDGEPRSSVSRFHVDHESSDSSAIVHNSNAQEGNSVSKSPAKINNTAGSNNKYKESSASLDESTTEDDDSASSDSTTALSGNEESAETLEFTLFPKYAENKLYSQQSNARLVCNNDQITVSIWSVTSFKKLKLTFFEIGMEVVKQVETRMGNGSSEYLKFSIMSAFFIGMLPMLFRIYQAHVVNQHITLIQAVIKLISQIQTSGGVLQIYQQLFGSTLQAQVVIFIAMIGRIGISFSMFFMLCVAEGTYKKRYMYAKFFGALTSTRRARRNQVPHFRLHKVKNIKAWLSLRSFLKKRGPQRSVDTIVSVAFLLGIFLLVICCVQFLSVTDQKDHFLSYFFSWEVSVWGLVLGVFLIRFIALGSDINRKYRNSSVLLTEQINLYLQMEKYPEKKEEFHIANNVLKLASDLLRELDGSFKISGFIMNPLLSNITRVVVLSLFSGVMSDILGFRLRLWKIKA